MYKAKKSLDFIKGKYRYALSFAMEYIPALKMKITML